jgi:hypothetical protein
MTTEIVIMNKEAVALAADSALTTGVGSDKVFHSTQKLFPLGRHHPVGIMIYQNAEFMGVPWETIIEIYRDRVLRQKSFKTFKAYANSFMMFLDKANDSFNDLFSESDQEEYFASIASRKFQIIRDWIIDLAEKQIGGGQGIGHRGIVAITEEAMQIASHYYSDSLKNNKRHDSIPSHYLEDVERRYKKVIRRTENRIFEKLPIPQALRASVDRIAINSFVLHYLDPEELWEQTGNYSGVVVAGFGKDDKFPSLESYKVGGIVGGRLICLKDEYYRRDNVISSANRGGIFPFAQKSMIQTFLTGIDPTYEEEVVGYFEQKARDLCKASIDTVNNISDEERRRLREQMERKINEAKEDYQRYIWHLGFRRSIPIEAGIVPVLPKDELALMAETLVSLASFEHRVSPGMETVGGPIDVAVISKADGFVWVKKKRYFAPEINPSYTEADNENK